MMLEIFPSTPLAQRLLVNLAAYLQVEELARSGQESQR